MQLGCRNIRHQPWGAVGVRLQVGWSSAFCLLTLSSIVLPVPLVVGQGHKMRSGQQGVDGV